MNVMKDRNTEKDLDGYILLASLLELQSIKVDLESMIMYFLITLVKTGQSTEDYLRRKKESLKIQSLGKPRFAADFTGSDLQNLWKVIDYHLKHGTTTIEIIMENVQKLVADIDNVAVAPLAGQLAWRNMTAVSCVVKALSSTGTFPWRALLAKNEIIRAEVNTLYEILEVCRKDPFVGYKVSGAGSTISHLAYLCIQLLVEVGGNDTLSLYKGVGSKLTKGLLNRGYLDSLIAEYKRNISLQSGDYERLSALNDDYEDIFITSGLSLYLTQFMSSTGVDAEPSAGNRDSGLRFMPKKGHDSDDEDGNPPPPRGGGHYSRRGDDRDDDRYYRRRSPSRETTGSKRRRTDRSPEYRRTIPTIQEQSHPPSGETLLKMLDTSISEFEKALPPQEIKDVSSGDEEMDTQDKIPLPPPPPSNLLGEPGPTGKNKAPVGKPAPQKRSSSPAKLSSKTVYSREAVEMNAFLAGKQQQFPGSVVKANKLWDQIQDLPGIIYGIIHKQVLIHFKNALTVKEFKVMALAVLADTSGKTGIDVGPSGLNPFLHSTIREGNLGKLVVNVAYLDPEFKQLVSA